MDAFLENESTRPTIAISTKSSIAGVSREHLRRGVTLFLTSVGLLLLGHYWVEKVERVEFLSPPSRDFLLSASLPKEVIRSMNLSVDPCTDFYQYVCGNWVKDTEIPPSRGGWSRTWDQVEQLVHEQMTSLVLNSDWPADSDFRMLNKWYSSCMDTQLVEELGPRPLQPMLERVASIQTAENLQDVLTDLMVLGTLNLAQFTVTEGYRDMDHNLLFISAAGLSLPDPSWYPLALPSPRVAVGKAQGGAAGGQLADTQTPTEVYNRIGQPSLRPDPQDTHAQERWHFRDYLETINELAGASPRSAALLANRTIAAETLLATWQTNEPPFPDPLGPNTSSLSEIEAAYPLIPFRAALQKMAEECASYGYECNQRLLADEKLIVVGSPYFLRELNNALADSELIQTHWKPLLRSHYIAKHALLLSSPFLLANLKLQGYLEGASTLPPREEKCIAATTDGLSALADMAFVHAYFGEQAQREGGVLLEKLKAVFLSDLEAAEWMDAATREEALAKAREMRMNLGGPRSYKMFKYRVSSVSFFNNSVAATTCRQLRQFLDIGEAPDAHAWKYPSTTVNAWYDNAGNALYVPAGMMQKPFFSPAYPSAQNFGAIGSVMGHEMSHGFDDTGAFFDAHHRMREWWSKPSAREFSQRARCISTLYGNLKLAGAPVNGANTLGEDIADMGGLKLAYRAFLAWYTDKEGSAPPLHEQQLVFIAFGQNWCDKEQVCRALRVYQSAGTYAAVCNWCDKEQQHMAEYLLESDEHAPSVFRTNAVVSQNADFANTFSCPRGSPMNPVRKCVMWKQVPAAPHTEQLTAAVLRPHTGKTLRPHAVDSGTLRSQGTWKRVPASVHSKERASTLLSQRERERALTKLKPLSHVTEDKLNLRREERASTVLSPHAMP